MSSTEQRDVQNSGFEVEITSGGREYDNSTPIRPVELSPARAAAKARAKRRNLAIVGVLATLLLVIAAWAWLSNPANNTPPDAVARVNGELIYDRDIDREINLTKAANELSKSTAAQSLPSRAQVLEDLISRKMQEEDARKAGVTVTTAEAESAMQDILTRTGTTRPQMDAALAKYSLKWEDMRDVTGVVLLINKYIATDVVNGATTDEDIQTKKNDWLTQLAQTSKVDRLKSPGAGAAPSIGSEAPDFSLKTMDGKTVKLSSLRGRPVMLNFWATWCPPCRSEIPIIAQMYSDTHKSNDPYEILGVATQSDESTIQAFSKELGINFPVLPDTDNHITDLYHVLPIPTSFLIDKGGIIRDIQIGPVDRPKLEKWLLQ